MIAVTILVVFILPSNKNDMEMQGLMDELGESCTGSLTVTLTKEVGFLSRNSVSVSCTE